MTLPTPDLKPHLAPQPLGSEACGCCDGVSFETPQGIYNRDGLSAIAYRVGDYTKVRQSLHASLSAAQLPALDGLRTRDDDDFTLALIDAFACAADVLTFYQERLANEAYLRTAVERVSLSELGKLIGYRLRPGLAAETWLAFALETPPQPPPTLAPEPGNFVTGVPTTQSFEAGLKVQSVPGPGEHPQTFETIEPLAEARPTWNALKPWLSEATIPQENDVKTYLAGVRTNLKSGDALLFVGDEFAADHNNNNWDFRLIEKVELEPTENRTVVYWQRPLGSLSPHVLPAAKNVQAYVLRKRAAVFGHNAPMWNTMTSDFKLSYEPKGTTPTKWPFALSPRGATSDGGYVDLDSVQAEVLSGSYAVLATGGFNSGSGPAPSDTYVELYAVSSVVELSRADFAISGKVTRLRLSGANYGTFEVQETTVFLLSERLEFAEYPVDAAITNDRIPVNIGADGLLPGRRLIIKGKRVSDGKPQAVQATLVAAHVLGPTQTELEIVPPLSADLVRSSVVVYANVALASHGESVAQVLGSSSASQQFQRFELKQLPLTYLSSDNELGAAAALTLRVGDVAWQERPSLFDASGTDRAFTLNVDEQGRQLVVFGDGLRGARLPSGVNNVRAQYRKGLGASGNVAVDQLTQLLSRPLGLKSVSNPLAAEGGTDPENAADARRSVPLVTRTLGRAVSLLDYEDFARAYSGISKARAQMLTLPTGPVVAISIAGPGGTPLTAASPVWLHLLDALKAGGNPHVTVQLLSFVPSYFRLGVRVKRDSDYDAKALLANVEATLRARYAFEQRELGQPLQESEVISVVQNVPGVVGVDITRLYGGITPGQGTPAPRVRLLAARMSVQGGAPTPAELLMLNPAPFDLLEEMP